MIRRRLLCLSLVLSFFLGCKDQANLVSPVSKTTPAPIEALPIKILAVDRLKREVPFHAVPQRIISLTPATTELMFAIGAGSQLVGVTKNCNYPPEAETLTRVGGGTLESLSRETIVSLHADLVLCKWDNHQPLMETLEQFKIPTLAIGPESLDECFVVLIA